MEELNKILSEQCRCYAKSSWLYSLKQMLLYMALLAAVIIVGWQYVEVEDMELWECLAIGVLYGFIIFGVYLLVAVEHSNKSKD